MWLVLTPFMLYAVVDYFFRLTNALLAPLLISQFALAPDEIGFLTGVFFVGFGLAQFPLGVLLDRFGPRPVVMAQLFLAMSGALLCYYATGITLLGIGRLLMGFGLASSLIAAIKAASIWLEPARMALIPGLITAMTGLGGMFATGPLAELFPQLSWDGANSLLFVLALSTFVVVAVLVRRAPMAALSTGSVSGQFATSLRMFTRLGFWRYAPIAMTCGSTIVAYQTLWMPIWLRDIGGFNEREIAWTMFGSLACLALGGGVVGQLTQVFERRGWPLTALVLAGSSASIAIQLGLAYGYSQASVGLWFALSFLYTCPMVVFTLLARSFVSTLSARASTNLNFTIFIATFAIQWGLGGVISLFDSDPAGGYGAYAFRNAMVAVVLVQVAAMAWHLALTVGAMPRQMRGDDTS